MKNVTITLDETTAIWARVEAAKVGKSLSRYLGDRLRDEMNRKTVNLQALERFLSGPGWPGIARNLPKREELYDRPALRRHEHPDLQPRSKRSGKTR